MIGITSQGERCRDVLELQGDLADAVEELLDCLLSEVGFLARICGRPRTCRTSSRMASLT